MIIADHLGVNKVIGLCIKRDCIWNISITYQITYGRWKDECRDVSFTFEKRLILCILYSVEGIFFPRIYFFKLSTIITLIITFCIREIGTATGPCEGEWILWIWVVFHHYFDTNKLVIIVPLGYWPRFSCIGDFVNAFAVCIFKKFLPRVTFCILIE